jgi:hypothetical protein
MGQGQTFEEAEKIVKQESASNSTMPNEEILRKLWLVKQNEQRTAVF